jgi:hypothetical protein
MQLPISDQRESQGKKVKQQESQVREVHEVNNPNPTIDELKQFAADLMLMKAKAGGMGLFKTMHAIEPATQVVGWEIVERIENESKSFQVHEEKNR